MSKALFSALSILGFLVALVIAAIQAGVTTPIRVVEAQGLPSGCSNFTTYETACPTCGGFTSMISPQSGEGVTGIIFVDTACSNVPDPPGSCTYLDKPTGAYNAYCCDQDNDGYARSSCGGNDCNDTQGSGYNINPGRPESCDGIDNNCNSQVDEGFDADGDGYKTCQGDCNDTPGSGYGINPGSSEICDSIDNNCDGNVDEGNVCSPCAQYGEGWFIGHDGVTCVPPQCADCYNQGGTHCPPCWTPILIDMDGNGFNMTNAPTGVYFRPAPGLDHIRTAWSSAGSDDAWLVLDRNGNGIIDDASELFSCAAPQPTPPLGQIGNGFIALAEFDKVANGGNGDNRISVGDQVFTALKLWTDSNHNGLSEVSEFSQLSASAIRVIELDYRESRREDEHGNKFKYRAIVRDRRGAQVGRWAYDVFPVVQR